MSPRDGSDAANLLSAARTSGDELRRLESRSHEANRRLDALESKVAGLCTGAEHERMLERVVELERRAGAIAKTNNGPGTEPAGQERETARGEADPRAPAAGARIAPTINALAGPDPSPRWRPEVVAFADLMERELRANDHKPGWKRDRAGALHSRLEQETVELEAACGAIYEVEQNADTLSIVTARREAVQCVGKEAADVANFAMMIADVCGALPRATSDDKTSGTGAGTDNDRVAVMGVRESREPAHAPVLDSGEPATPKELLDEWESTRAAPHPWNERVYQDIGDRLATELRHQAECGDEMQRAIMRLPVPPDAMGDGPDERVGHALELIKTSGTGADAARRDSKPAVTQDPASNEAAPSGTPPSAPAPVLDPVAAMDAAVEFARLCAGPLDVSLVSSIIAAWPRVQPEIERLREQLRQSRSETARWRESSAQNDAANKASLAREKELLDHRDRLIASGLEMARLVAAAHGEKTVEAPASNEDRPQPHVHDFVYVETPAIRKCICGSIAPAPAAELGSAAT